MSFFNPTDVITGGAKALPGTGVAQEATGRLVKNPDGSIGRGSLATLGGGPITPPWAQTGGPVGFPNSPQPMPTMNPDLLNRFMDPNFDPRLEPGFHDPKVPQPVPFDPNSPFGKDLFDPGWGIEKGPYGNRGNGQPLNQPMGPTGLAPFPGSLQSLGGNQSSMVNLRGPDGSMKAVPQNDLAHWLSKGAVRA